MGLGENATAPEAGVEAAARGGPGRAGGLHRVIGVTDAKNGAAAAVLERLGMRREAHFVENVFFKGAWGDEYQYALLGREWAHRS